MKRLIRVNSMQSSGAKMIASPVEPRVDVRQKLHTQFARRVRRAERQRVYRGAQARGAQVPTWVESATTVTWLFSTEACQRKCTLSLHWRFERCRGLPVGATG